MYHHIPDCTIICHKIPAYTLQKEFEKDPTRPHLSELVGDGRLQVVEAARGLPEGALGSSLGRVSTYIYIYILYTHNVNTYTYVHIDIYTCIYIYICVYMHVYFVYISTFVHVFIH